MRFVEDRIWLRQVHLFRARVLHGPTGWNWSATMTAWSGPPGRCRCGCWPSGPGCAPGCRRRWRRRGFDPVYDRGQVLVDLAVAQLLGGEAISDFQGLRHLAPVIGPVPVDPDGVAGPGRGRRAAAGPDQRGGDRVPAALVGAAGRPPGRVPLAEGGRAGADRDHGGGPGRLDRVRRLGEGERPAHLQGRHRVLPRTWPPATTPTTCWRSTPARATPPPTAPPTTSPCSTRRCPGCPGRYRRRMLVRLDGAGFSHELLEHIAAGGGTKGRHWEFSVGWSCTDREIDAIARLPDRCVDSRRSTRTASSSTTPSSPT